MTKTVSCTVVRSVPLARDRDPLMRAGQPHNKRDSSDDVIGVNVKVRRPSNSAIYSNTLGISRTTVDYRLSGQILDCYV